MNALSKADMTEMLCNRYDMGRQVAKHLVDHFFESIRVALESGRHVKLSGFGNFILRDKGERPGRNPKTGKEIPVRARRVVTFKTGMKLKGRVEKFKAD